MIGHVSQGAYFLGCISYTLEDKLELSEQEKEAISKSDKLRHKNRAEVIHYNRCFGNKKQLAEQFNDVAKLSKRVEKPVIHFSFSLAPGEKKSNEELIEMAQACAREFEFDQNQFIVVRHHDTHCRHFHIVANRVGADGVVAKDNHSKRRVAALCRQFEKDYGLKEVLSPRAFLPAEKKYLPRNDKRKARLITNIKNTLETAVTIDGFIAGMTRLGYQVEKRRGITFIDDRKVRVKGSDIGFSLSKIERILAAKLQLSTLEEKQERYEADIYKQANRPGSTMAQQLLMKGWADKQLNNSPFSEGIDAAIKLLEDLLKPVHVYDHIDSNFMPWNKKKKKKQQRKGLGL